MVRTRAGVMNPHTTRRPTSTASYLRVLTDVKRAFGEVYEIAHPHYLVLRAIVVCHRNHIQTRKRPPARASTRAQRCHLRGIAMLHRDRRCARLGVQSADHMKSLQWETRHVRLNAEVELPYHVVGRGLPVLLANGLGGSREIWDPLIAHASDRYRFVAWEYRGLHPVDHASDVHDVPSHARDALAILDAEAIARCGLVGWSMGVAVSLELFSQAPTRAGSLVSVCGGPRLAWFDGPERSLLGFMLLRTLQFARRNPRASVRLLRMALQSPEAFTWARRLRLVGEQISSDRFARMVAALLDYDFSNYVGTLERLSEYDASAGLAHVDIPTLAIGGDRDPFTPRAVLEALVQGIPGAEYLLLPEGTHYALLDQAEHVCLRIEKFWNERGYASV
jgi:pimeloyl-ACP methyl ester carboxylesterase